MLVVHQQVMTAVVAATKFVTASNASKEAFKTANLLKNLSVNTIIYGDRGTGRSTLAKIILPKADVIDSCDFDVLLSSISKVSEIIIKNIDTSPNLTLLLESIDKYDTKIVATCRSNYEYKDIDNFFSLKIELPPLANRIEDVEALTQLFLAQIQETIQEDIAFDKEDFVPDLSQNSISLKKQIFSYALMKNINKNLLMQCIEQYLSNNLGTRNDYRENLHIYEVPLLRAGLKKFKSQLKLADKLGLNRNTLRKKIADNIKYGLQEEKNE